MRDFGDDVFEGTAKYYAKYRPAYPNRLFNDIVRNFNLDGKGQLLDLGCGTGELAIPLANYFEKILAVDPDEEMLSEGRKKASKLHVDNIEWQKASSRDLIGVKGPFRLVTMGQSFHWMDEEEILEELYTILEDSGGVAIVASVPTTQNRLSTDKDKLVKELITKYLGPKRRAGKFFYKPSEKSWEQEIFPSSNFRRFEKRDYKIRITRNIDEIVGSLFSMSYSSKQILGKQAAKFESELRQRLKVISGNKKFVERANFMVYFLVK